MWHVLKCVTQMMSCVLSFTAEEIWQQMCAMDKSLPKSVLLADWPENKAAGIDPAIEDEWDMLMLARQGALRGLEAARGKGIIGHPLDAEVQIKLSDYYKPLEGRIDDAAWESILIVSCCKVTDEVKNAEIVYDDETTGLVVGVSKSAAEKCPRCWKRRAEVAKKGICDRCRDVLDKQ